MFASVVAAIVVAVALAMAGRWDVATFVLASVAVFSVVLLLDERVRNTQVARNVRAMSAELKALRRAVERGQHPVPGADHQAQSSPVVPTGSVAAAAADLVDSGYFDAAYYSAASNYVKESRTPDRTPRGAAEHYLRFGVRTGHAPHPLIEPEYIPVAVRDALVGGDGFALVRYLRSKPALSHAWGPVFDPRTAVVEQGDALTDNGCLFQPYTRGAALPVPVGYAGKPPTLPQIRNAALANAVQTRAQLDAHVPEKRAEWDADIEREWLAAAESDELPSEPLVSVVMPVWNREQVVASAIDSVLQQTYQNWELIVVDDGSTDSTVAEVRAFAAEDERIRLVEGTHAGVGRARNLGIEHSSGELIAFLDSDNRWLGNFLEMSVRALGREPGAVAAYSAMRLSGPDGQLTYLGEQVSVSALAKGNAIDMNTLVARAAVLKEIGSFDTTLKRWVDYDLILRLAARGPLRYMPFIGCDYFDGDASVRITSRESSNWQFVPMGKHMVDWENLPTRLDARVRGRVSIVMLTYQEHRETIRSVDRVLRTTDGLDVEVILVDNGSRPAVSRSLSARYAGNPRVAFHRLARNYNFAIGSNVGYARSTGEFVLFLNNDTEVREGWLLPLLERLKSSSALAVQPLMVFPNDTVQTAGTVFADRDHLPVHLLAHHPQEDARRHGGQDLSAVTAGAMLLRAETFELLRGFDPIYANGYEDIDFCLRARERFGRSFEVEAASVVVHEESKSPGRFARETENQQIFLARWKGRLPGPETFHFQRAGFDVAHLTPTTTHGRPLVVRPARTVDVKELGRTASLRWAIKIGASTGPAGDKWGDVPYAQDLAAALERLGQEAVVDRHGAFSRTTSYLDDVVLTLRGRYPVERQSGRVNAVWVISRPGLVSAEELAPFDLIYAASPLWAAHMTQQLGREVRVLHQATNPAKFNVDVPIDESIDDLVFVGGARPEVSGRPMVSMALESTSKIGLWGPNWKRFAPASAVRGDFLPFDQAPTVYRSAGVVLNDHWQDMAEWGFISNRTFDAVAAGTPVITDPVAGLELFGGAAVACSNATEMRTLLRDRSWQPGREQMAAISARIRAEHSFDVRAATLLEDVLALRSATTGGESA